MGRGLPLSNSAETIILAGNAEPGIGPVTGRARAAVYALAAVQCRTHIQEADPAEGSDRGGDLESVAGYLVMAVLGRRSCTTMRCPVFRRFFPGSFERLSHAAVNFQSLFVRASRDSRFCSPNEQ